MRKLRYLLLLIVLLDASDKPPKSKEPIPIPAGAIKIPLPHVEQPDGVSCGAACMMSICSFYDVGPQSVEGFKNLAAEAIAVAIRTRRLKARTDSWREPSMARD